MTSENKQSLANLHIRGAIHQSQAILEEFGEIEPFARYLDNITSEFKMIAPLSYTSKTAMSGDEQIATLTRECNQLLADGTALGFSVIYEATLTSPEDGQSFSAVMIDLRIEKTDGIQIAVPYTSEDSGVTLGQPVRLR